MWFEGEEGKAADERKKVHDGYTCGKARRAPMRATRREAEATCARDRPEKREEIDL